jgi:hypothetical protein
MAHHEVEELRREPELAEQLLHSALGEPPDGVLVEGGVGGPPD